MVRLGVEILKPEQAKQLFQFQYGAIGRVKSTRETSISSCFNSSMVRLGVDRRGRNAFCFYVSIPVWCDWESRHKGLIDKIILFQFQYGAIGSFKQLNHLVCVRCFNSSMVRLGDGTKWQIACSINVSIPVWCDWELFAMQNTFDYSMFQFQYGAIGRSGLADLSVSLDVSIPVWCDWELIVFPIITIPSSFQFQYGAIGRDISGYKKIQYIPFQFQYGAIGSLNGSDFLYNSASFQFQYGAIGRVTERGIVYSTSEVSIPVWCDWE